MRFLPLLSLAVVVVSQGLASAQSYRVDTQERAVSGDAGCFGYKTQPDMSDQQSDAALDTSLFQTMVTASVESDLCDASGSGSQSSSFAQSVISASGSASVSVISQSSDGYGEAAASTFFETRFTSLIDTDISIVGEISGFDSAGATVRLLDDEGTPVFFASAQVKEFRTLDSVLPLEAGSHYVLRIEAGAGNRTDSLMLFAFGSASYEVTVTFLACVGDLDGDDLVGASDLAALIAAWGDLAGDLNGDEITDAFDLAIVLAAWGACP